MPIDEVGEGQAGKDHHWQKIGQDAEWHEPLYECAQCHARTINPFKRGVCDAD